MDQARIDLPESLTKLLTGYIGKMNTLGPVAVMQEVKVVKLSTTFDKQIKRIEVKVESGTPSGILWAGIRHYLCQMKEVEHKYGTAPQTNLERQLQGQIDGITGQG